MLVPFRAVNRPRSEPGWAERGFDRSEEARKRPLLAVDWPRAVAPGVKRPGGLAAEVCFVSNVKSVSNPTLGPNSAVLHPLLVVVWGWPEFRSCWHLALAALNLGSLRLVWFGLKTGPLPVKFGLGRL